MKKIFSVLLILAAVTFICSAASAGALIGEARAKEAALSKAGMSEGEVTFSSLSLVDSKGRAVYDMTFRSASIVYRASIDAETAEVVDFSARNEQTRPDATSSPTKSKPAGEPKITPDQALGIAVDHAGVKRADIYETKVELDRERGRLIYEVEFKAAGMEYDYDIDADSGAVLKWKKERD